MVVPFENGSLVTLTHCPLSGTSKQPLLPPPCAKTRVYIPAHPGPSILGRGERVSPACTVVHCLGVQVDFVHLQPIDQCARHDTANEALSITLSAFFLGGGFPLSCLAHECPHATAIPSKAQT